MHEVKQEVATSACKRMQRVCDHTHGMSTPLLSVAQSHKWRAAKASVARKATETSVSRKAVIDSLERVSTTSGRGSSEA